MRYLEADEHEDPILSVVNIIDVFLVIIAILFMVVIQSQLTSFAAADEEVVIVRNPGKDNMTITIKQGEKLEHYESTGSIGEGQGIKAGITYRMADGTLVYVPEIN
ncbi:DUF2149 domain-containing protein [Geoalkalibacter halelectricus]|uniref:DUF2149 domain-containing protein n=1 Tax=Geoalkalibacter halelectricus TaxID=2847045 RepID=UPI00266F90C4|nr:DUF2149 domain-containing protein [Geoalkalibacter halelectricus]MDO3380324.1 DUF2149 domain-containing protein [Geoalkalibacter halelectricus]